MGSGDGGYLASFTWRRKGVFVWGCGVGVSCSPKASKASKLLLKWEWKKFCSYQVSTTMIFSTRKPVWSRIAPSLGSFTLFSSAPQNTVGFLLFFCSHDLLVTWEREKNGSNLQMRSSAEPWWHQLCWHTRTVPRDGQAGKV